MQSIKVRLVLAGLLFAAALVVLVLPQAGFSLTPEYATVGLTYDADAGTCAVDPENVMIYVNEHPNKVKWVSNSGTDYYWDIVWKGGDEPNYFNKNFDIKCGKADRTSNIPSGHVKPGDRWPYSVVVYSCNGNQKGEQLCEVDPGVDWGP